jgi:hypothetical protein
MNPPDSIRTIFRPSCKSSCKSERRNWRRSISTDYGSKMKDALSKDQYQMVAKKPDHCQQTEQAVVADGPEIGQVRWICREKSARIISGGFALPTTSPQAATLHQATHRRRIATGGNKSCLIKTVGLNDGLGTFATAACDNLVTTILGNRPKLAYMAEYFAGLNPVRMTILGRWLLHAPWPDQVCIEAFRLVAAGPALRLRSPVRSASGLQPIK